MMFALGLSVFAATVSQSLAGSVDKESPGRQYKVHFPDSIQRSCHAILFSVGTGVSVGKYDTFAEALVQKGYIVAIVDPERGSMTKLDANKLQGAYAEAKDQLLSWTSACDSINKWIVGGHSAGGGTAHKVLVSNPSLADAIFSVDPFTKGDMGGDVRLPALYWGFDVTTCFVTKSAAAEGYYGLTENTKRVFYRAEKVMENSLCGFAPKYFHCSIVDGHCPACTNCKDTPAYFFEDIANSVDAFINSALTGSWSASNVEVQTTTPVVIFVASAVQ